MVALAGRPNVGKSTLANALAGAHVAGVSARPQTTRRRISAVVSGSGWQAVLLDLPGFQRPADRLTARMQATVDATLAGCDAALVVLDATERVGAGDRLIAERLRAAGRPVIVVVNKVDRADPGEIAATVAAAAELLPGFLEIHPVSARTGEGLDALRADLPRLLSEGPALYPEGMVTDQTEAEWVAELVREAALGRLRQELPHALAVAVQELEPAHDGGTIVRAALLVESESQKGIVIGARGAMIREIGSAARAALGEALGRPIHLDLRVRVRRRWRQDEGALERLGL